MRSKHTLALTALAAPLLAAHIAEAQPLPLDPAAASEAELEEQRDPLRAGEIDPLRSPLIEAIGGVADSASPMLARATRSFDPTLGNPNPWAGLIGPDDFHVGFEGATPHTTLADPGGFVPLAGQTTPEGFVWGSVADFNGVVDNSIAQTGPNWNPAGTGFDRHGVAGGPDPNGVRGQFFASPRGTIEPQAIQDFGLLAAGIRHDLFTPTADAPVTVLLDLYLDDITTFVWWRPINFAEGGLITNVFMGGINVAGLTSFTNEEGVLDRFIVLGRDPIDEVEDARFFVAADPHRIVEREWFQLAIRLTGVGDSVWVRDSSTIGVNGFAQDSIYDGFPGDDARGAFAGEILASDWLQIFPGVEDDPNTAVVEGKGPALGEASPDEASFFLDDTGSPSGQLIFSSSVDAFDFFAGEDPSSSEAPGYQPHDWYMDNYTVLVHQAPCPGDLSDNDRVIDGADLGALLGAWGSADAEADLNADGVVDGADLGMLLGAWGPCP